MWPQEDGDVTLLFTITSNSHIAGTELVLSKYLWEEGKKERMKGYKALTRHQCSTSQPRNVSHYSG